jgi:sugar/nucleoside kinase (ribokinase family)
VDAAFTATPDLLLIGAATRDLLPGGGWRLGGTAVFAALTAARLGLRAAIVTSGPPDIGQALAETAPEVAVALTPAADATTFENVYDATGARRQYLRGQAAPLTLADVPTAWRAAPLVLLAPLAREVGPALAAALASAGGVDRLIAATPQGWLRQWDATGLVRPGPWEDAERVLPALAALILSWEDLVAPGDAPGDAADHQADREAERAAERKAEEQVRAWSAAVPRIALTRGAVGADLITRAGRERFPAYVVRQVDPTGAGDVFAAAFLAEWCAGGDARQAMDFANCAASFAVERVGTAGIPTRAQVMARMRVSPTSAAATSAGGAPC